MKGLAIFMLFLNPVLWASFYAVSKWALRGVDPLPFAVAELSIAAVPALALAAILHNRFTWAAARAGLILGVILFAAVIGSTIAVYYTTATNTAFFPALNGAIAALITVTVLKQAVGRRAWLAVALATAGAVLLIAMSSQGGGNPKGDLIALVAAAIYTVYIFAVDRQNAALGEEGARSLWIVACVELVTMAALAWIALIAAGKTLAPVFANADVLKATIYVGLFTTFAPTVIALFFQRYVSPMTVALLYVLEPVWGAIAARLIDNEAITLVGYIGGALIVAGSIANILGGGEADDKDLRIANA